MESRQSRQERRIALQELLRGDPFLADWQLADELKVSVATIRLDRMALDIPELRERARNIAASTYSEVKALRGEEVVGELIELNLEQHGTSVLMVTDQMVFARNQIMRGHFLFAQGNSMAVALVDAEIVLTKSADVRFYQTVHLGERVVAKARVTSMQGNRYHVSVNSFVHDEIVFQGEFVVVDVSDKGGVHHD
ncbi:MAG TPA: transcription factor FapR [Limnochordia bacterium]|nr:transcription factor FapR [Limnochordia bacterium]